MEEQKEVKKKPISKEKLWLIVGGTIIGVAIIVGIVLAFLLNYNSSAPNKVQISELEDTYFSVNANDNYHGYRFVFDSDQASFTINSEKNVINTNDIESLIAETEEGLVPGREYQISACYLGQTEGANSDYSQPVPWVCTFILATPELEYNEETYILSWNKVGNADYYNVYYNVIVMQGSQTTTYENITENSFDLNQVEGGKLKIYVCALSTNAYLNQSYFAEFELDFHRVLKPFESATVSKSNYELTIVGQQNVTEITINIGQYVYDYCVTPTMTEGKYVYKISLVSYASEIDTNAVITVKPSADEYNIFEGQPTRAQII